MNIFYLDEKTDVCAMSHCDKHVVKMILEYAQLLSTAHRIIDGTQWTDKTASGSKIKRWALNDHRERILYKATHRNHPSAVWARESRSNYLWLLDLFQHLLDEYTFRYNKKHKTGELLDTLKVPPKNLEDKGFTKVPQAMPDTCKRIDSVEAYRYYYATEKRDLLSYTKRSIPEWLS